MALKRKQMIIIFVSLAALLAIGSAFLLVRGISKFGKARDKQKNDIDILSKFYEADPFPSRENVDKIAEQIGVIGDWFKKLEKSVGEDQISLDLNQRSPSRFMSIFANTRQELNEFAAKNGVKLPDNFAFGFNAYASGVPPNPDDVARLTQQLLILKEIFNVIIEERVESVTSVQREIFEKTPSGGSTLPGMSGSSDGIVNTNAGVIAEGKIYGRFQYIINLHAKETALVGLINKMSSHGLFITIKSIQMKKTGPDVRDRSSSAMPVYGGPGAIMPGPGHPILPRGGPGGSDEEEKASGFSIEPPMEISLLLDVYVFKISEGGSQN